MKIIRTVFTLSIICILAASLSNSRPAVQTPDPKPAESAPVLKNQTLSWYVVRNKDHQKPRPNTEGGFALEKYDAYYTGSNEKVIFLTFDEGYENGYTAKILDILKSNQVPAAFFVTEPYIQSQSDLVRRMVNEGHIVGNHSKTHPSMPSLTRDKAFFTRELQSTASSFREITGKTMPLFFRPPKGEFSEQSLSMTQQLGYKTIFWSFAYEDWLIDKQPAPASSLKMILSNTHNGEIMLLHAVSATNTAILDQAIKKKKKQGYRFGSLTELK